MVKCLICEKEIENANVSASITQKIFPSSFLPENIFLCWQCGEMIAGNLYTGKYDLFFKMLTGTIRKEK